MRLERISIVILTAVSCVQAQGLDFNAIFKAKPSLRSVKPISKSKSFDRAATASSIISQLSLIKPKITAISTKTTTSSTSKPKVLTSTKSTTKSTSTKKIPTTKSTKKSTTTKPNNRKKTITLSKSQAITTGKKRIGKRQITNSTACSNQTILYGYVPTINTPSGFLQDISLVNQSANAFSSAGYTSIFSGLSAAVSNSAYLGYRELSQYNVTQCTALCDALSACQSVNLFFERAPVINPGVGCENPPSATIIRCSLWGVAINSTMATNVGQWRSNFMVVITGSIAFLKNTPPPNAANYVTTPLAGLVDVNTLNTLSYINSTFYPGAWAPLQCTTLCTAFTAFNRNASLAIGKATYVPCNFVNAAIVSVNGVAQGTYCSMYTTANVTSSATTTTATYNSTPWTITYSYGYSLATVDGGITSYYPWSSPLGYWTGTSWLVNGIGNFNVHLSVDFTKYAVFPTNLLGISTNTIANGSAPYGRAFQTANVQMAANYSALLLCQPTIVNGNVPAAQIQTTYSDIMYGSVRTIAMASNVSGVINAFLFYGDDNNESDIDIYTKNQTQVVVGNIGYHSTITSGVAAPANMSSTWHEYRMDWLPGKNLFYIDGVLRSTFTLNVPGIAGAWLWLNAA